MPFARKKQRFFSYLVETRSSGKNLDSVRIDVMENGGSIQSQLTKDNVAFLLMLDLNHDMNLFFSKTALYLKRYL